MKYLFFFEEMSTNENQEIKTSILLRNILNHQNDAIFDYESAQKFLIIDDLKKDLSSRLISWLIIFHLITPIKDRWELSLSSLYKNYKNICLKYTKNETNDLNSVINLLQKEYSHVIVNDSLRTAPWFLKFAGKINIINILSFNNQDDFMDKSTQIVQRTLALVMLENPDLQYVQGQDRFIWISYLLSLNFMTINATECDPEYINEINEISEAITYHLGKTFIDNITIAKKIENYDYIEYHFQIVDSFVRKEAPEIALVLDEFQNSSLHYALKWELTLFAEEYDLYQLLYLWDDILAHIDELDEYLIYLIVAHVKQVPIPRDKGDTAITIQRYKSWDVYQIIKDANQMIEAEPHRCCCYNIFLTLIRWLRNSSRYQRL